MLNFDFTIIVLDAVSLSLIIRPVGYGRFPSQKDFLKSPAVWRYERKKNSNTIIFYQ